MATVSNIRRLTTEGRDVATKRISDPNVAIELVRIFDLIDVELGLLVAGAPPVHRRRRHWRGFWRRNGQ